jgi:hypothetical protein
MGRFRNSKAALKTQDLTAGMAAFGPSTMLPDWVQTQPRRSSHADTVTNRILQASANFQNLSQSCYSLLLRNLSLLLLDPLNSPDQNSRNTSVPHCQFVEHSSPDFDKLGSPTV